MKDRPHYTYEKEWWCNECDRFIYFPESVSPESCPRCQGTNIVLRDWKGYKRSKPSASSIDPYDSRASAIKIYDSGYEMALTFSVLSFEDVFELLNLVEAQKTDPRYDIPEKVYGDASYRRGFSDGLVSLLDDSKPE